jgi:hypothetical protein
MLTAWTLCPQNSQIHHLLREAYAISVNTNTLNNSTKTSKTTRVDTIEKTFFPIEFQSNLSGPSFQITFSPKHIYRRVPLIRKIGVSLLYHVAEKR